MNSAVIQSVLSQAEARIEHLTGITVKLFCEEVIPVKRSEIIGCETDEQLTFFLQCCDALKVTPDIVRRKSQKQDYVAMRQAIAVALKETYRREIEWKQIASLIGVSDHSTAINAYTTGSNHKKAMDRLFMYYYTPLMPLLDEHTTN